VTALSNWEAVITTMPGYHHVAPTSWASATPHIRRPPARVADSATLRARAMVGLLDMLGVQRAHLVGNSMAACSPPHGAGAARTLRPHDPDGDSRRPIEPTADLITMITYYDDPSPASMLDLRAGSSTTPASTATASTRSRRPRRTRRPRGRPPLTPAHLQPRRPPLVFSTETLTRIHHEVLLVHGREDRIIRKESSAYLADLLPNAQLHVLPHAGHWVQIEQVDRFRALATQFLEERTVHEHDAKEGAA